MPAAAPVTNAVFVILFLSISIGDRKVAGAPAVL